MQKKLLKKIRCICLLFLGLNFSQAQVAVLTAGGHAEGSGGSVSYSVGQLAYVTNTGTLGTMLEGVQQVADRAIATKMENFTQANLQVSVSPNPAMDHILVRVDASARLVNHRLQYQLLDISGKVLEDRKIDYGETIMKLHGLNPGVYFVRVSEEYGCTKTIKLYLQ